jgi:hypothetical protein
MWNEKRGKRNMLKNLLISLGMIWLPILVLFFTISPSAKKDVQLYRNTATQKTVTTPLGENMTDAELYNAFKDQTIWEYKLVIGGYLIGLAIMYIILKWIV